LSPITWAAKIEPRRAAIAIGCNVDTMMKHYVGMDEQAVTDEVFAELTPRLAPKGKKTRNSQKNRLGYCWAHARSRGGQKANPLQIVICKGF
jgi:hypothetical protein